MTFIFTVPCIPYNEADHDRLEFILTFLLPVMIYNTVLYTIPLYPQLSYKLQLCVEFLTKEDIFENENSSIFYCVIFGEINF